VDARPTFSVIIPCYNYGHYLRDAIDSALAQAECKSEIIVVDDASTDDTATIAESYGKHVRYYRNETNLGAGGAWGRGLELAAGEFVVKLDADDELLPNHHEVVEKAFREYPGASMVISSVLLVREGSPEREIEYVTNKDCRLDAKTFRRALLNNFFFRMPGCALRRACLQGHDGPDAGLYQIHDWEFFLRVCKGHEAAIVRTPLAAYRIHERSISAVSRSEQRLFKDVDRWLEMATSSDSQQFTDKELDILRGSLAIQLVTGFGSHVNQGVAKQIVQAYLKAVGVALDGGLWPFLRLQGAAMEKALKLVRPQRRRI
jgi:glycosyltransferase involved in cell wall biosynthesis